MVYWLLAAFVAADLQVLVEKLANFGINRIGSTLGSNNKLGKLTSSLDSLQSSIYDTEDTQMVSDHALETLLCDFEDVRYSVEDFLDEFVIEVSKLEGGSVKKKHLVGRLPEHTLDSLQVKLDYILKRLERLQLVHEAMPLYMRPRKLQTTSLVEESRVFGRETDITNLLALLQPSEATSTAGNVSVIPIIGVIGVGKTTLAQLAYNHDADNHPRFHIKIWVSVPVTFDVISLTRSIIEEASRQSDSIFVNLEALSNLESLQHKLADILRGKKFLLVLDDLWNVKRDEWGLLLKPLNRGLGGSKILVTTGSRVVSKLVATAEQYELTCLSSEDCWKILKQEAFGDGNLTTDPELENIGLEIARKCEGLPLAAKIVAEQLPSNDDITDWKIILKDKVWDLPALKNEAASALQWGFHRLPLCLRQCVAYCSMFPQSYKFEKHKIIRMWIGGGLISCDHERNMPDETGSSYVDQLLQNSFFRKNGDNFIIQAAVQELIQSVSSHRFLRLEETSATCTNEGTKHLSLICDNINTAVSKVCEGLRSLVLFIKTPIDEVPLPLFGLGMLRVLDFSGTRIKDLTGSIGNLIHLRFLDLSNTLVELLPETMKELCALQTLILTNNPYLLRLPDSTCKLRSLLHLQLGRNNLLSSMPSGIGRLIGLQTVDEFIIGSKKGQINELKNLNNIRGSLCIKQLENVKDAFGDLDADLASKKNLESLEFQWSSVDDAHKSEILLSRLVAPQGSLKQLVFRSYGGKTFPQWASSPLFSKLVTIFIDDCENCKLLPTLGRLPKLKFLKIIGMDSLLKVDELFVGEIPGFPLLETLEFSDMPMLEGWVGAHETDMPRLRKFSIAHCPQLVTIPSLHHRQCLEELEFVDCPKLPFLAEEKLSTSVKSLFIINCVLLEYCYRVGSEDWIKIEHIPTIKMGGNRPRV